METQINNCGIYYIQNIKTSQLYIGQSKRLKERKNRHFYKLRQNAHENAHLQNSFNKYGEDSFEYGVIEYCNENQLDPLEIAYMNLFNVKTHGFNISDGGHHGGHKKEYAHLKLSSFNRHGQRMYGLVYQNQIIRSNNLNFLKNLLNQYFDELGMLKQEYTFDDIKKESKQRMGYKLIDTVRIVKRGKKNNKQNYSLKYGNKLIRDSVNLSFLNDLIKFFFDSEGVLKTGFTIDNVKISKKEFYKCWKEIKRCINMILAQTEGIAVKMRVNAAIYSQTTNAI